MFKTASEDDLYELIDKVDQCEIARRDKADAEIAQCKADYARESDSKRKTELAARESQLVAANRDLRAQYEKQRADLRSAFMGGHTTSSSAMVNATRATKVDKYRPQRTSPCFSRRKKKTKLNK